MHNLLYDLRYSVRALLKSPGFTLAVVLTLALGIGANSAMFSLVSAVLIEPLPFADPQSLVVIWEDASAVGLFPQNTPAVANYYSWRERNSTLEQLGAVYLNDWNVTGTGEPFKVNVSSVTASLFPTLGVAPLHGRVFSEEEDRPGDSRVVVLSYRLWHERFGGSPEMVGREITLDGRNHTVIGVMPRDFLFPDSTTDLWAPAQFNERERGNRASHYLRVVGRLKPGVKIEQAQADFTAIMRQLQTEFPDTNRDIGAAVVSLRDDLVGQVKPALLTLLAAVGFVLLIACSNIANLTLVRVLGRRSEWAVRSALGASRLRLAAMLLAESLLLSLSGGLAGVVLGQWAFDFLGTFVPERTAGWVHLTLDARVLGFTAALSVAAGLLLGLGTVWHIARADIARSLHGVGSRTLAGAGKRSRNALAVAQIALSLVLLVGAGLMIRSFAALRNVELGFRPEKVLTAQIDLPFQKYQDHAPRMYFYDEVLEHIRRSPGIESAGFISWLPLTMEGGTNSFTIEGGPPLPQGGFNDANVRLVTDDYFATLGIPLKRGRLFDEQDRQDSPPVVIVNEAMGRQFWPGEDALGHRIKFGDEKSTAPWMTIVGVIGDVRQMGVERPARAEYYFSNRQWRGSRWLWPHHLAVRTSGEPLQVAETVRKSVWAVDRGQPVSTVRTMESIVEGEMVLRRLQMALLNCFAGLALLLAALGIFGVLSYGVAQRRREIGLRMALGAKRGEIVRLVLVGGFHLAALGLAIGLAAAMVLSRAIESLLFEVEPWDAAVFAAAVGLLLMVSLVAAAIPARRAASLDPMEALRYE